MSTITKAELRDDESLREFFDDHQMFHSEFQIDYFIVGPAGTDYGQYRQVLRELVKRWRGLKQQWILKGENELKLAKWRARATDTGWAKRKLAELKVMKFAMAREEFLRTLHDTEREFRRFVEHARALKERLGELTPARRAVLDAEMWEYNLKRRAAIDLITSGRLSEATVSMLRYFPADSRPRLVELLTSNQGGLIDWFQDHETFALPELDPPELAALSDRELALALE